MKRQGQLNLSKHKLARTRLPILFAGVGTVALTGCGESDQGDYSLHMTAESCDKFYGRASCDTRYQTAQEEAQRTAMKFRSERECEQEFGDICTLSELGWHPTMAGFYTHKLSDDSGPFFTTLNPNSSHYGYGFTADGTVIGELRDLDGNYADLAQNMLAPLPTESVDGFDAGTFIMGMIAAEAIDELGDMFKYKNKRQKYDKCRRKGGSDSYCQSRVSGTYSFISRTHSRLNSNKVQTYRSSSKKVVSSSRGGFGKTGSSRGGFGG